MLDEGKSCRVKTWSQANFSFNTFGLIRYYFHVASVYSLFHPIFHCDDAISNFRTSNFKWCNKTKTLIIQCHHFLCLWYVLKQFRRTLHSSETFPLMRIDPQWVSSLYSGKTQLMSPLYPLSLFNLARLFIIRVYIISGKKMSVAIFDLTSNERINELACWMENVGWRVQAI